MGQGQNILLWIFWAQNWLPALEDGWDDGSIDQLLSFITVLGFGCERNEAESEE